MLRKSGYVLLEQVDGFVSGKLPAKRAEMRCANVIHHPDDVHGGCSETEMSERLGIQITTHRNGILAAVEDCIHFMYNCWVYNDC